MSGCKNFGFSQHAQKMWGRDNFDCLCAVRVTNAATSCNDLQEPREFPFDGLKEELGGFDTESSQR